MAKILGIDLGSHSIGWAIRDISVIENQITAKGVLTFQKGVGEERGKEVPLVKARTEARSKRRNYQAEKYRKWELLSLLVEQNMCPLSKEELNEWRWYKKGVGRKYPQSKEFIQWLRFDFNGDGKPDFDLFNLNKHESYYAFRMLAVSENEQHKKVFQDNSHLLGRIFYQLVQRRGYRGRDDEGEEAQTILKGSEKNGTPGIEVIAPYMVKYKSLGAALYYFQKENGGRIRRRYNLRTDYELELKEICRVQNLDDETYQRLWKAIIWQRPLRSQKGLVGYCTFESPIKDEKENKFLSAGKKRAPVNHPLYEEFRTWVFINNLKISLPSEIDAPKFLSQHIYPVFFNSSRDFKLSSISKRLKKAGGEITAKFSPDTKVLSCTLLNSFEILLGKDWKERYGWNEVLNNHAKICCYSFEDIWHVLFTFDNKEKLKEFALEKLKLDEEKAERFSKITLQQGYGTLSLSAIKKILPFLHQGFLYSEAVYLANLHKVLGQQRMPLEQAQAFAETIGSIIKGHEKERNLANAINSLISDQLNSEFRFGMDADYELDQDDRNDIQAKLLDVFGKETWQQKMNEEDRAQAYEFVAQNYLAFLRKPVNAKKEDLFIKPKRLHDKIFSHLQETYGVPEENKKYLWHPSEQETYLEPKTLDGISVLGDPRPISNGFKNPMALRTLHELKKLINYLLQNNIIDEDTRIVVEIARELNDANTRKALEKYQRAREKENDVYRQSIQEILIGCGVNLDINKDLIDKYRLWVEQNRQCLYTGYQIDFCEWFNGNLYDFEHTIPASISFDNELKNLTVANAIYNRQIKGNKLPTELPNYYNDAKGYTAIQPRLKFMEEKIDHFEKQIDFWSFKAKAASTKESKDEAIVNRHFFRFHLDYWRKKYQTFTVKEYKAGWRNNQLKDTQIVTKYALPYLKTIFKKVDVQKGSVTAVFREIFQIQPRLEKKQRTKHSHHAIDAAVLTLIPPAAMREKILFRYNRERDENRNITHEKPRNWKNFEAHHLLSIEDEVLNNFQSKYRVLTQTVKKVRKRGKQQFVKEKTPDGKWLYKRDAEDNRIPLIAKGDTVRGQLHDDTFFAAIKQPIYEEKNGKYIPKTDDNGNFIFEKNPKRKDDALFFVTRHREGLNYLKTIDDLELIVDPNLKAYIKKEIEERMSEGKTFAQAISEPLWAFGKKQDRNGKPLNPIRHIRTKVKSGGGGVVNNPTKIRNIESFPSKKPYKQHIYALNGETSICALYQSIINDELVREIQLYTILDLAHLHDRNGITSIVSPTYEKLIKKEKYLIPLYATLKINQKVLFYEEEIEELQKLSIKELSKRLYLTTKFEDGRISFRHHLNAMPEEDLKKEMKRLGLADVGASSFDFSNPVPKLRLSRTSFNFAIEGKHFEMRPSGEIDWLSIHTHPYTMPVKEIDVSGSKIIEKATMKQNNNSGLDSMK